VNNFPIETIFLNTTIPTLTAQIISTLESNNTGDTITFGGPSVPDV
jgi:hypothetical protein